MCLRKLFGLKPNNPPSLPAPTQKPSVLQSFTNGMNQFNAGMSKVNNELDYYNYKMQLVRQKTAELQAKKSDLKAKKLALVQSADYDYSKPEKKSQVDQKIALIDKALLEVESIIVSVTQDCEDEAKRQFGRQ